MYKGTFNIQGMEKIERKMFKIDKIRYSLDCDLCEKLLVDPVAMVCGKIICKCYLDKLLKDKSEEKNSFICEICKIEHLFPENGLFAN